MDMMIFWLVSFSAVGPPYIRRAKEHWVFFHKSLSQKGIALGMIA